MFDGGMSQQHPAPQVIAAAVALAVMLFGLIKALISRAAAACGLRTSGAD